MGLFSSSKPGTPAPRASGDTDYARLKREIRERKRKEKAGETHKTKAEERAEQALAEARDRERKDTARSAAHKGVSENELRRLERLERLRKKKLREEHGTSIARVKRHGNEEDEELELLDDEGELDKSALEARLGIASPFPRSILRPRKIEIKKTGSSDKDQ